MKTLLTRSLSFALVVLFIGSPVWATCGGGGGGGGGGMSGSGGSGGGGEAVVYHVPWKMPPKDGAAIAKEGLIVYWFPASKEELQKSSLRESRALSLFASQCVTMQLADNSVPNAEKLIGGSTLPVAVLATVDGTPINKVENQNGKLKVEFVEKLVTTEVKQRESSIESDLKDAKAKADAGDKDSAIKLYRNVVNEKCMFPKMAKEAVKQLKSLGVGDVASIPEAPVFDTTKSAVIEQYMRRGLAAEDATQYVQAEKYYSQASRLDPADPTPLRYLGELYRHHIGNWIKARSSFSQILRMPADPLSRAVALHGLGKMTIHDGEFKKGLGLMEKSVEEYPIALALRNLAVYWNSEGNFDKANAYTQRALELNPTDPYNLIFGAVYLASSGKQAEALKIAEANQSLLSASYNLAAIYALSGQKERALELLRRHFFEFERYQAVREKEMMEARVDTVFDSLRDDPKFMSLTAQADGKLPMPMRRASN
jgi:tetratricopeptide (TPR) repeat protein